MLYLETVEEVTEEISSLRARGAPSFGRGLGVALAARKRARHRRLPQPRRLRPLLHEEIRTVVSFDENLARAGRKATGPPLWRPDCTRTSLGEPWSRYAHAVVES